MKIVVLEGSPNKNGSSNLLAGAFIRGAQEAGHTVEILDAAHADIHPCTGCIHCGYKGPCVQKNDVERFRDEILDADMMVFVTPLYYYGMSAQLKTLIHRFCAFNSSIQHKHMKSAMLAAVWNSDGMERKGHKMSGNCVKNLFSLLCLCDADPDRLAGPFRRCLYGSVS